MHDSKLSEILNSSNQSLHALLIHSFFFNCPMFSFSMFSSILRLCSPYLPSCFLSSLLLASASGSIMTRYFFSLHSTPLLSDTANPSTLPPLNLKFTTSSGDPLPPYHYLYRSMLASAFNDASVLNLFTYLYIHLFVTIDRRRAKGPRNREFHYSSSAPLLLLLLLHSLFLFLFLRACL